jgi:hypothetical protein
VYCAVNVAFQYMNTWRAKFDRPELPEWPSEKPPKEEISFSLLPALILAIDM